ncbi:male-enhanced antigen 1 [Rhinatrema bivittatum]|uniref:male-enhanced antigen 1 n=1 Tax=Rhinatrema bivittatum TaxID=194408 RepID=UPI00112C9362|nr:male-enhanced antigen 1 [Rhinatrema bivittatum]XP_029448653.1 male-enhanced antigen 1 [Rhinatrema bivittatum]
MEVEGPGRKRMGPERIFPNTSDDAGEQVPHETVTDWSNEEPEEDQQNEEEEDGMEDDYCYQPLNQEPEQGAGENGYLEQVEENEADPSIQERLQAMRLHLPDPPVDSEEEEEAEEVCNRSSIPMDADHVQLVIRTMAGVKLPSLGVPSWAQQMSDQQWQALVHRTLQTRTSRITSKHD